MNNIFRLFSLYAIVALILTACNAKTIVSIKERNDSGLEGKELLEYQYAFTEATKQKIFGNIRQAASLFHKCLDVKPASSAVYYQLGDIYLMMGNPELAIQYSKNAVHIDESNYWYHQQLVRAYQAAGFTDSALIAYEHVTNIFPDNDNYLYNLALLYMENSEYLESIKVLKRVEKIMGVNPKLVILMHELYYKAGKKSKAIELLNEYLKILPDNKKLLLLLAVTLDDNGETGKAYDTFQNYITKYGIDNEIFLAYTDFLLQNGKAYELINFMGQHLPDDDINDEIILQSFLGLLESDPSNDLAREVLRVFENLESKKLLNAKYKTIKADYLIKLNKPVEAANTLEEIVTLEKNNPVIWKQLLLIYISIRQWDKVIETAGEALIYFPDQPDFFQLKGYALTRIKKHKESIDCLERGLDKCNGKCKRENFYSLLADNYYQIGNLGKSFDYFEEVLKLQPGDLQTMNNYSFYLAESEKNLEKAREFSKNTIQKMPDQYTYLDTYAWILYKLNEIENARIYIEKALRKGGINDAGILFHYGMILLKAKEEENAKLIFQKVLSMDIEDHGILEQVKNILDGE